MIYSSSLKRTTVLLIMLLIIFNANLEASVATETSSDKNFTISYPIVHLSNNINAQNKINNDISHYVRKFKKDYYTGAFMSGKLKYKVKYEDDMYISIMLIDNRYISPGAAHSIIYATCINYDKNSGEKLPLAYFVKLTPSDLNTIMSMPIYDENNRLIPYRESNKKDYIKSGHAEISSNYYLEGNGKIALVYQPYALASFAHGLTHITLDSNIIDYFNRKNP